MLQQKECWGGACERWRGERWSVRGRSWQGPVFPVQTGAGVPVLVPCSPLEGEFTVVWMNSGRGERIPWAKEREDPEDRADTCLSQLVPVYMGQSQVLLCPRSLEDTLSTEYRQDTPPEGSQGADMA